MDKKDVSRTKIHLDTSSFIYFDDTSSFIYFDDKYFRTEGVLKCDLIYLYLDKSKTRIVEQREYKSFGVFQCRLHTKQNE